VAASPRQAGAYGSEGPYEGRIASVEVDYNDRVTAGQVLARFDHDALAAQRAEIRATMAAGRATVEQARTDRDHTLRQEERAERLFASNLVSEIELDAALAAARVAAQRLAATEAQLAAQQSSVALANTNLEYTVIRAPIDGIVVTRNVDPGQTVASALQAPVLFTVAADLSKMRVVVAVDEADIGEVAERQRATFTVSAYPNRTFDGVVTQVRNSPEVVHDVVTYGTEVEVDNADLALKPGMTATVRICTATANDVLRVPSAAFDFTPPGERRATEPGVWILTGDVIEYVPVAPGTSDGEFTSVSSAALTSGAMIVYELTSEGRKAYGITH
jgi:HlyD family secretion protein